MVVEGPTSGGGSFPVVLRIVETREEKFCAEVEAGGCCCGAPLLEGALVTARDVKEEAGVGTVAIGVEVVEDGFAAGVEERGSKVLPVGPDVVPKTPETLVDDIIALEEWPFIVRDVAPMASRTCGYTHLVFGDFNYIHIAYGRT
jgi:hypothetical protein